jgi:hypothetical protein
VIHGVRVRGGAWYAGWLLWTVWVVAHAFTIPAHALRVLDAPLATPHFLREALARAASAVGGGAVVVLAAWGIGSLIADRTLRGLLTTTTERIVFPLAAGCAALAYGCLGLAAAHAYRPAALAVVFAGAACLGVTQIVRASPVPWRTPSRPIRSADRIYLLCAGAAVLCALIGALAPEIEYDALSYHLWLPARWLASGRPVDIVQEYTSLYPLTWEMLYGAAMAIGGPVAAKLTHWMCLPLLGATSFMVARRLCPGASGALAAALTVTSPVVLWEGTTAYVDLALAWYAALAVYGLFRHHATRDRRWLTAASLLMGVALGIKHLGVMMLAITAPVLIVSEWRAVGRRHAITAGVLFVALALVPPVPWYARAYLASGNPVFPELYSVFGARPVARWSAASERGLKAFKARFGRQPTVGTLATLPWDVTVHAAKYGGTLGPLFLVLVPAAVGFVGRRRRTAALLMAAGCVAYVGFWASPLSSLQIRFLLPIVPLLAVLGAVGAARLERSARAVPWGGAVLVTVTTMMLLANLPPAIEWHEPDRKGWDGWLTHVVRGLPVSVLAGMESQDTYLARQVPSYRVWQFIDATLPSISRVLTFEGGDLLYSTRARLWSDAVVARDMTWNAVAGEEASALREAMAQGITHVIFDKRQIADGTTAAMAIGSEQMHACCLTPLYEDHRFALYALARSGPALHPLGEDAAAR